MVKSSTDRIILGIDPGTNIMGYGIIELKGNKMKLLSLGVVKLDMFKDHMLKLQRIFEKEIDRRCFSKKLNYQM